MPRKPKDKKKPSVRFTKSVERFICEKVAEGYTVSDIVRLWPDEVPSSREIYKRQNKKPDFFEAMDNAYFIFVRQKADELDMVSKTPLSVLYPELDAKEAMEARRARIDALKFQTSKLACVLSKRFDKAQKVEVSGELSGPQIVIQSYCMPEQDYIDIQADQHKRLKGPKQD